MEFKKFNSIEQFRSTVKAVGDHAKFHNKPLPTLKFRGTVKLHGTNAGIIVDIESGEVAFQSRTQILEEGMDNAGFKHWAINSEEAVKGLIWETASWFSAKKTLEIFGEWCGGNIQKGVALNQLDKMFVVFSIVVDGVEVDISDTQFNFGGISSIYAYPHWEIDIDFNNPEASQNTLVDLTLAVEAECPVGKYFGISGVGEGIVWHNQETGLKFKVKGEKHSVSKVKTLRELAPVEVALIQDTKDFVSMVVTQNRLNQGLEQFDGVKDVQNLGAFIKWVVADVFKEERDTINFNGFDNKVIGSEIAKAARAFFLG